MNKNSKIFIAGHNGMVGSSCLRKFHDFGFKNLIVASKTELNLKNQLDVNNFLKEKKPDIVIDAAAKVGGIWANNEFPYEFLYENMVIQNNLINSSLANDVSKFVFLGSSCIYPKNAPQPINEEDILTSSLEKTNESYALAKITGVKLCESIFRKKNKQFISLMPTNLYGPNDNFDIKTSHVIPAMIRKFHDAKINNSKNVQLWGDGSPMREFMFVDDLSDAIFSICKNKMGSHIYNIGSGQEITISQLASLIKNITSYKGNVKWLKEMPNGTPRKLLNSNRIKKIGWNAKTDIISGIEKTYQWYLKNIIN